MKKSLLWVPLVGLLVIALIAIQANPAFAQNVSARTVPGKVLVKFNSQMEGHLDVMRVSSKNGIVQTGISGFDALTAKHGAYAMKRVFPIHPQQDKEDLHRKHGLHLWYELSIPRTTDVEAVAQDFKQLKELSFTETVKAKALIMPNNNKPKVINVPTTQSITGPVNDPLFFLQWHYSNDGKNGGITQASINLPEAWKTQTGNPTVVVSVHDLGVDITHQDLWSNIWINEIEKNGKPGVDDDYNGYIDDINGFDFSGNSGTIPPGDHATHVSGTIAAINNNGIGVSGIAGGDGTHPGVRIMSAKVLEGEFDNVAASYMYAADNGAVISQNSWGYTSPGIYDQSVIDGIDYFIDEAGNFPGSPMKGGIVIFASGNSESSDQWWPAIYNRVMAVSALGRDNKIAFYSNYGTWVDISAPGGDQTLTAENGILSTLPGNTYGFYQGTSMATPHVSGVAALIVSQQGGPGYKNSDLWTALLSGTHDINIYNPDYANQLGVGYLDAALALKTNQKIAPAKMDLKVTAGFEDYINLAWSVSTDTDDGTAASYEIIYSNDSLSVAQRKSVKSIIINSVGNAGDQMTTAITSLIPKTHYYFAGYAKDRWGNTSGISTIVSSTTQDGPSISVNKSEIDFTIAVNTKATAMDSFHIINAASGDLKWKTDVRQTNYNLDYSYVKYPTAVNTPTNPKIVKRRARIQAKKIKATAKNFDNSYQSREIGYAEYEYAGASMIGEEDTTIPNSAATKFTVTYPDGFNLTDINMLLNHNPTRDGAPCVIEIYKGDTLQIQNLIYAGQFNGYSDDDQVYDIQLSDANYNNEQIFLPAGTTFWVVVHVPAGHLYPLGLSDELQDGQSDNCFVSFDIGKTWTPLAQALGEDGYVWVQLAESYTGPLDQYMTLTPAAGTIPGQDSTNVNISVDASKLINGTYYADAVILNNDYSNNLATLPLSIKVSGQKPLLTSTSIIDFGGVFAGTTKDITININNNGFGNFVIKTSTISNGNFKLIDVPYSISALSLSTLKVRFTGNNTAGAYNGTITLTSTNGDVYKISVFGSSIKPSKIAITPPSATYSMALGATVSGTFAIKNSGSYPLQYFMPKFTAGDSVKYVQNGVNRFGYSYITSKQPGSGLNYSWTDISSTGTDVSDFFKDNSKMYYPVNLGFDFPIFNKTTNKLMLTRYGMLTIDDQTPIVGNQIQIGDPYEPFGYISGLNEEMNFNTGGKLYYQVQAGQLIVQYENVSSAYYDDERYTFQIIVLENGNFIVNYKDISTIDASELTNFEVAIEDPEKINGYLVSNYQTPLNATSSFSVEVVSPGSAIVSNVSAPEGIVAVGATVNITYDVNSAALTEGQFWQNLTIVSNDPITPVARYTVNLNITSGGTEQIVMGQDSIGMGEVFVGDSVQTVLQVQDTGTKAVSITSVSSDHGFFKLKYDALPDMIKPRTSAYINVKIKGINIGTFNDVIHVAFDDGTTKDVKVNAIVEAPPAVDLVFTPVVDTLNAGEFKLHDVTITNTGASDLQVVPSGNSWVYYQDLTAQGSAAGVQYPANTYYASNNKLGGDPNYLWEEIKDFGTRIPFAYGSDNEEKALKLPFSFTFYGKKYDTIYVNPKGLLSFTGGQYVDFFTAVTIPQTDTPNNFIAPYWSNGAYDGQFNGTQFGVYYKQSSDAITFEFYNITNIFGMGDDFHCQAILYPNGNIKFQYSLPGSFFTVATFGLVGVENIDGTQGVRVAANEAFIQDQLAVLLTPATKITLAAGDSKKIALKVDATNLLDGSYSTVTTLQTNVPGKINIPIPASVLVHGYGHVTVPSTLNMGTMFVNANATNDFQKTFTIANDGSAQLDFSSIRMASGKEVVVNMWVIDPWFGDNYWSPVPASFNPGDFSLTPKAQQNFMIDVTPSVDNYLLQDTLIIESNSVQGAIRVPVIGNVSLPPVMSVSQNKFVFVAADKTYTSNGTFQIDNSAGQSPLNYSLNLSYQRGAKAQTSSVSKSQFPKNQKLTLDGATPVQHPTATVDGVDGYNRTLEYSTDNVALHSVGVSYNAPFWAATKFQADEKGFTLSHVQSYYFSQTLPSSPITVQVYVGVDINTAVLLTSQDYLFPTVGTDYTGMLSFALTTPQTIYAYETFFVVINYPFGAQHPQGTTDLGKTLPGTFLYYTGTAWTDLTESTTFATTGYMVKALEKTYAETSWLTLATPVTGSVATGKTMDVNFNVFATNMIAPDDFATLQVSSNAPNDTLENISIDLRMNQAPQFNTLVTSFNVDEMDTLMISVPVRDLEGDAMTITIANAPKGMTFTASDTSVVIQYVPDYLATRVEMINITATDAGKRANTLPLTVHVGNVNRPPVVVSKAEMDFDYGSEAEVTATSKLIADPDTDDILTVVATSTDPTIVTALVSSDEIRIKSGKVGAADLIITMTDNWGATAADTIHVKVNLVTGIETPDFGTVKIYPNPTSGVLNVTISKAFAGPRNIYILNSMGIMLQQFEVDGQTQIFHANVSGLTEGLYLLMIQSESGKFTYKFIKK